MSHAAEARHLAVLRALQHALPPDALDPAALHRLAAEVGAVCGPAAPGGDGDERLGRMEDKLDALLSERWGCRCVLRDPSHDVHLLTGPHRAPGEGAVTLEEFLAGARALVVADPYFYARGSDRYYATAEEYADRLIALIPRTLAILDVFHLPGPTVAIRRRVQAFAAEAGIQLRSYASTEIHDRVWIRDRSRAKVVGTSFNGLGRKLAFILDLPPADLDEFQQQLRRIRHNNAPLPPA